MSSLFAEVWFWALLAFLIGALLTWVLIVRPLQQRADQQERRLQQQRRASAAGGAAMGGATGLAEPEYGRPQEPDWAEAPDAGRAAPPTQWLERDSLPPQRTPYPQELVEEDYPLEQETRYTEDYPVEGEADYVEEYEQEEAELAEYDERGEVQVEAEPERAPEPEPAEETHGLFESTPIEDQPPMSGFDALDTASGARTQSLQPDVAEPTQRVEPEWPEVPTRATPPRVRPSAPAASAPAAEPETKPEPAEPGFFDDEQPTTAVGPDGQLPDIEPEFDPDTGLPKRTRGASSQIRGGFEPPRPIQPSVRPIARRTPQTDTAASAGSLFEPSAGEVSPAAGRAPAAAVPPGPFGPGSAMPLPGGGRPGADFTVKGSVTALRYCPEDSPRFGEMVAEVWFATPADAERVGFRPLG